MSNRSHLSTGSVLIFDSHPVQYKAPVYKAAAMQAPGTFEVIYATDRSTKGYRDEGFACDVAWDTPLLEGYPFTILGNERRLPLSSRRSLSGSGIWNLLSARRPRAILLTQLRYEFDFVAYFSALLLGISVWIRQETQDEMFAYNRSWFKQFGRYLAYKCLYFPVKRAFCFGELNREHLERHGVSPRKIRMAYFSVPNPLQNQDAASLLLRREEKRRILGVLPGEIVISFFGKLIPKKNPELLFSGLSLTDKRWALNTRLLFVGSGELENNLRTAAADLIDLGGTTAIFAGFVNQSKLSDFYLASDIVVLPSRRLGEAWGLVINEALHAGCGVVLTDAVGCYREFAGWERVRIIQDGDAEGLAIALVELGSYPRSFDWAAEEMKKYSTESAAAVLSREFAIQNTPVRVSPTQEPKRL